MSGSGSGAGATGAERCNGLAQQAGVAQPFLSQLERQQADFAGAATVSVDTANPPCTTSANPSSRLKAMDAMRDAIIICCVALKRDSLQPFHNEPRTPAAASQEAR